MNKTLNKVCLITGVGDGTGAYTARRFAKSGYKIAMIARDKERLSKLERELPSAKGYICDVSNLEKLHNLGWDQFYLSDFSPDGEYSGKTNEN